MKIPVFVMIAAVAFAGAVAVGCASAAPPAAPTAAPPAPTKAAEPAKPAAAEPTKPAAAAPTAVPAVQPTAAPKVAAWPEKGKTITLIVPFAPGGSLDSNGRLLAADLEKVLGVSIQILNREGAGGQTGVAEALKAKPDGYTLVSASMTTTITQILDTARETPYKSRQDFTLIAGHTKNQHNIVVRSDSPWKTLKELADDAKANPRKIRAGTTGIMAIPHLEELAYAKSAGVEFAYVHFNGGAQSLAALLGGHVEMIAAGLGDTGEHVKNGTLRILGVIDTLPLAGYPDVPTLVSQGYDVPAIAGTGIMGPKGMPKEVVDVLTKAIKQVLDSKDQIDALEKRGASAAYLSPDDYAKAWDKTETLITPSIKELLDAQKK